MAKRGRPRKTPERAEDKRLPIPNVYYEVTDKHGNSWKVSLKFGEMYEREFKKTGRCGGLVSIKKVSG